MESVFAFAEDVARRLPDSYAGVPGICGLHHWEITAGKMRTPAPDPPEWLMKAHEALAR